MRFGEGIITWDRLRLLKMICKWESREGEEGAKRFTIVMYVLDDADMVKESR